MGKRILTCAVAIAGLVVGAAHANARESHGAIVTLKAKLTGTYVHAPATGSGTAVITFTGNKVCWKFAYKGIGTPTVSGIHHARPPSAGRHKTAIIPFTANTTMHQGCTAAKAGPVKAVLTDPSAYWVGIGTVGKYTNAAAIGGPLR